MNIVFAHDRKITAAEFVGLLLRSGLAKRRPIDDVLAIQAMLEHADLLCTAWHGAKLIGVARSVTDFEFCCYLSDLAVAADYQRRGIGRRLVRLTRNRLGPRATIILLAVEPARDYYPGIGFKPHGSAWILSPTQTLTGSSARFGQTGSDSV